MKAGVAYIRREYNYRDSGIERKEWLVASFVEWLHNHPKAEVVWVDRDEDYEDYEQWTIFYREPG